MSLLAEAKKSESIVPLVRLSATFEGSKHFNVKVIGSLLLT